MNGNNNSMCNQTTQIPKNLPLKKRRAFIIEPSSNNSDSGNGSEGDENCPFGSTQQQRARPPYPAQDPLQLRLPPLTLVVPTPPTSPHIEFLRQHYAYWFAGQHQNYLPPSTYDCLMAQKVFAQQFLNNYRTLFEQSQYQISPSGYTLVEDNQKRTDVTIDEHFRKSLGENYEKFTGGFLTPDGSSANSSPIERTPVDSIEEHFARSLGQRWPLIRSTDDTANSMSIDHQRTESVVDDHFAKALGATTWEKLKEKS